MNEPFILPVTYQGKAYELKARFERWGYTHRIAVLIDETTFTFEPDEEGGYRALSIPGTLVHSVPIDAGLLNAIAEKLISLNNA
ncbi:hypothetical protein [Mucilaginibacter jinjuensis]|uniref:Uncharacterized protein n=1 Tax=Mucilaginibacter jinjuensis TaxID=1176721 RepID=A0ABY7TEE1_9SPHI|nr:hypothetical protein [Mucilaginibacter jinjuensis]WCT14406.1 hypothetical protein PQO05_10725 [Mucilaginibacter jinjuensis]